MSGPGVNPYIGARSFERQESLFGRDREARELSALLVAERIVLLYSPSGAGKTSLIQARLVGEMEKEGFEVLPVIRVSTELGEVGQEERSGIWLAGGARVNRYLLSALLSLEEGVPPERQISLPDLARTSFAQYLALRAAALAPGKSPLLIFDQFEEALTLDPTALKAKEAFFDEVGAALRNRDVWALFSMREDYVGALEPYLRRLPTRLRTTFRLDLLDAASARLAIRGPAERAGVTFSDEAAAVLTDNLRTVWVQRTDGTRARRPGPSIEPVQLQVVCRRLWDRLPEGAAEILPAHVEDMGDVDAALASYYAEKVAEIARSTKVSERAVRDWVEGQLITEQRMRGQVLYTPDCSQGLENEAIHGLIDAYLVREEKRRGSIWFELAHDRLIEPVKEDNAAWLHAHLNDFQRQAALWLQQGRPDRLLLYGSAFATGEQWVRENDRTLTAVERDFLVACRKAREQARIGARLEEEATKKRRFVRATVLMAALALVALASWAFTFRQMKAVEQARQTEAALRSKLQASLAQRAAAFESLKKINQELERKNDLLVQQHEQIALPSEQIAAAGREAAQIAAARPPGERALVQYFAKDHDERVIERLRSLGFQVKALPGKYDGTNTIWYGASVDQDDVRLVALALTQSGVKIQQVTPRKRSEVIAIGTDTDWLAKPIFNVKKLRTMAVESFKKSINGRIEGLPQGSLPSKLLPGIGRISIPSLRSIRPRRVR